MKALNKAIDYFLSLGIQDYEFQRDFLLKLKSKHEFHSTKEIYEALVYDILYWRMTCYSAQQEVQEVIEENDKHSKELQKVLKQNFTLKKQIEFLCKDIELLGDLL